MWIFQKILLLLVLPTITYSVSQRGKEVVVDSNQFKYCFKESKKSKTWRCSDRSCSAKLYTDKLTGSLKNTELPEHNHGNGLLKSIAQEEQKKVISKYASMPGISPKSVLQEISTNVLSSSTPGCLASVTSAGGIKMALWRERNKVDPRPAIPKSHEDFMETNIPDKFSNTADGETFLLARQWFDNTRSVCVFLSNFGAEILRKHHIWCLDGTFKTTPIPYAQVMLINTNNVQI